MGATIHGPASGMYSLLFGRNIADYMPTAVTQLVVKAEAEPTDSTSGPANGPG